MASRPPDLSSTNGGTGLEDLLVTPQELHRNSTLDDMDGLELFTDTLFWDLDLARFLDEVDYSRDVRDARGLRSNGSSNGSNSYGGSGLGGFEEEDFFNAAVARDPSSSTLLATPGYDFLDFKFPATEDQGAHHISPSPSSPQYQHHHPISTVATTDTLDGVISPRTATTTASPSALVMPRSPSSPTPPRSTSHLSDYIFPPMSSESSSSNSPTPPLHHHHHCSASLSEQDAHILSIQESARIAAEEDKRRRNTAASARFRIKKKQRDQAIEKAAKEMADRVSDLEKKIAQLELENRWLRNLFVEKNAAAATTAIETAKNSGGGSGGSGGSAGI